MPFTTSVVFISELKYLAQICHLVQHFSFRANSCRNSVCPSLHPSVCHTGAIKWFSML